MTVADAMNSNLINYRMYVFTDVTKANVAGRITEPNGNLPLRKVMVVFTDRNGGTRLAQTNGFGYYSLPDLNIGETYGVTILAKGYNAIQTTVTIVDYIDDFDFIITQAP